MWKLVLVTLLAAHGDISLGHPLFEATESQSPLAPPSEIILHSSSTEATSASERTGPEFPHRPAHCSAGFVALGDSYSAGIGTGLGDIPEDACRHGIHAYPVLIQQDILNHEGGNRTSFQFLSCTGSTINDLLSGGGEPSQIDKFNTTLDTDFALLSVGGNDLGFFDIMNSCIFRFYSVYSGTCEAALRKADEQLASPEFEHRLQLAIMEILDKVHWEKRPWFTITITGYARFFNAKTEECDNSSFGIWWQGPKLKREVRQRMNEMVLAVNDKIRRSVNTINDAFSDPRVFFVDYDADFEGHRFCEPNVTEPDYTRNETWFFLVGGNDNSNDQANESPVILAPESSLIDPDSCLEPATRSGDWGELALCMMVRAAQRDPTLRADSGRLVAENSMWYVPTYYGKTFHPVSDPWQSLMQSATQTK